LKSLFPFNKIVNLVNQNKITCSEIVNSCLENIDHYKQLNAFVNVYADEAKHKASEIDKRIVNKNAGKLAGMVVGVKDLFCYKDHPVQASSKILEGFISQINATSVDRIVDADAIIIGHQNCDQFGMGSSNENSIFGPVRNKLDPKKVSGGSSGGSAVAVQSNMCHVSLCTDTGGSSRQPASFCGIFGLKPTYSRVSRHGVIAYASSLDTVSILSKDIADCASVLEVISGADNYDSTVSHNSVPQYSQFTDTKRTFKIAYLKEALEHSGLQQEIRRQTYSKLDSLHKLGHQIDAVKFPLLEYVLPTYYILANVEASSNLACYDGIRYGYRNSNASTLKEVYFNTRTLGFGWEVKRRILIGTYLLSEGYSRELYKKAQKVRRLIKNYISSIFLSYDFIVLPTTPTTAFVIKDNISDPVLAYLADLFTVPASIAGIPAISVPNGLDSDGMPIGLQILANSFEEDKLLSFADYVCKIQ